MAMSLNVKLEVSGVSLASLIYELVNSTGDQEGLLFGSTRTKNFDDINDSQISYNVEEFILCIHQILPCAQTHSFCDRQGIVDEARLKDVASAYRFEDLIGWYRFRRNSTMDVYFQERAIHKSILDLLPKEKRPYFLFGLFTSTTSNNVATHTIDHNFLRLIGQKFETISARIINLSDTAHTNYKTDPPLVLDKETGSYSEIVNSTGSEVLNNEGFTSSTKFVSDVQASLQARFKKLCQQLGETEQELNQLNEEIIIAKKSKGYKRIEREMPGVGSGASTHADQINKKCSLNTLKLEDNSESESKMITRSKKQSEKKRLEMNKLESYLETSNSKSIERS